MPLVPGVKLAELVLFTRRSGQPTEQTVVTMVLELFPLLDAGSPPPDTVAVLVTLGEADADGSTVTVMALALVAPAAIAVLFVQLT